MTTKTLTAAQKRVAALEEKLKQAKAKASQAANKIKAKEQAVNRRLDTRRKILIGAFVLEKHAQLVSSTEFDAWLTRDDERALFNLPKAAQ